MFTRSHSTMRYRPACAAACAVAILAVAAGASASTGNVGAARTKAAAASSDVFGLLLKWGGYGQGDGQFCNPGAIAVDPAGNVYVADRCGPVRIQKFDPTGAFLGKVGSAGSGAGQFTAPGALATDAAGNLYVLDTGDGRINEYGPGGAFLGTWGSYGTAAGQIQTPIAFAILADGTFDVVDSGDHTIKVFGATGAYLRTWGSFGSPGDPVENPYGPLVFDAAGDVFAAERVPGPYGSTILTMKSFTAAGVAIGSWTVSEDSGAAAADAAGNLYVAQGRTGFGSYQQIEKFASDGTALGTWGSAGDPLSLVYSMTTDAAGSLYVVDPHGVEKFGLLPAAPPPEFGLLAGWSTEGAPQSVAVAPSGDVYVADSLCRIEHYNQVGMLIGSWNTSGGGPTFWTCRIATDSTGHEYVSEYGKDQIEKFSSTGDFLGKWGGTGSGDGQLAAPTGIATDAAGHVYVVDTGNDRVEIFDSAGHFVGKRAAPPNPWAIAVTPAGDVYIAAGGDEGYFVIYGVSSSGTPRGELTSGPMSGLAADAAGNVFVGRVGRIDKFDNAGVLRATWGFPGSSAGQFYSSALATDAAGNVYVADWVNERIQKFAPNLAPTPNFLIDPSPFYFTDGPCQFRWDATAFYPLDQASSLKIVSTTAPLCRWMTETRTIAATPGTSYDVSAWLKTLGTASVTHLSVNFWDRAETYIPATVDAPVSIHGPQDWTQLSLRVKAPANAAFLRVEFRLNGPGTLWADDLAVSPVEVAPPPPPPPPPPVSTAAPVVSGIAQVGQTLTTTNGGWTGQPTWLDDQWLACTDPSSISSCAAIVDATSAHYTLTAGELGKWIRARVSATGSGGTAEAISNPLGPITQAPPTGGNLARDPDVELNPGPYYFTDGPCSFSWATDASHSPTHALKIYTTTNTPCRWMTETRTIAATPGTSYDVSAWLKTLGTASVTRLSVNFWDRAETYIPATVDAPVSIHGPQDWTQLSLHVTAPANAAFLRVEFRLNGPGTLWADDIAVTH